MDNCECATYRDKWGDQVQVASRTDVGKVRAINEDYLFVSQTNIDNLSLAILADGMGGHLAGEVASAGSVNLIAATIIDGLVTDKPVVEYPLLIETAIERANSEIYTRAQADEKLKGMGTTIVLALLNQAIAVIGHIGDSRAYLFSDGELTLKTSDHTLVNELYVNDTITQEEALIHPQKHVLTRALGTDAKVNIDLQELAWKKGDIILLCSDGLTSQLAHPLLEEYISKYQDNLEELADSLINLALEKGGEDNISLILMKN